MLAYLFLFSMYYLRGICMNLFRVEHKLHELYARKRNLIFLYSLILKKSAVTTYFNTLIIKSLKSLIVRGE